MSKATDNLFKRNIETLESLLKSFEDMISPRCKYVRVRSALHNGIVALKYYAENKKAEQQGLLLRLPCKIGSTVYVLATCDNVRLEYDHNSGWECPYELKDKCPHECESCDEAENKTAVYEDTVAGFVYNYGSLEVFTHHTEMQSQLGDYIFLTKEEAEKALAEREG